MQQLHEQEQWDHDALVELVTRSDEALVLCDPEGRVLLANGVAAQFVGVPAESMTGLSVGDLGRDAMRTFQRVAISAVADNGIEVTVRHTEVCHSLDGAVPADLTLTPTASERGVLVVVGLRETTDRHRQTRLFRGLLEAAPDAMVIVDDSGSIVLVNAQVEKLFGYVRTELIGEPVEILVPDRFAGMHLAFRNGYVSEPRTRPMGLSGDLFARRRDGSEFPVEVSLAPLETEGGLLISAAVRDMSERRRMQEETDRIKDEFFATVSHELRTPLTSMIGYGELMSDLEELSPQGRRFLSVIMRSAERELRLVDDLLTLVAIEESGLAIEPTDVGLEDIVREAVEAARPRAEETGLDLVLETPGTAVPVRGDRDRLGQVMDNLLSNALKFTPTGGRIGVIVRRAERVAEVDVVDTGTGIGDGDAQQIFERLFRAPSAVELQVPGAGLGLTIALAIVEAHQGRLEVVRSGPRGTTFRMTLPLVA